MAYVIPMSPLSSSGRSSTGRKEQIRRRGDHNRLPLMAALLLQKRLCLLLLVPVLALPILPAPTRAALSVLLESSVTVSSLFQTFLPL